jgi:hypothetical protein
MRRLRPHQDFGADRIVPFDRDGLCAGDRRGAERLEQCEECSERRCGHGGHRFAKRLQGAVEVILGAPG